MAEPAAVPEYGLGRKELQQIRAGCLQLRDQRLARIRDSLQREQRQFLDLLPLLFHVNHPLLPGFVDSAAPAGVADYRPGREELLLARRHARSFALQRGTGERLIRGLYLMGSLGSLGQEAASDLDIWLCHAADLSEAQRSALAAKIRAVEAWGASFGLEVHIFAMQAEAFRDGRSLPLSDESSGRLGRHLLLEEFYRSNVLLAGALPLWWVVPPQCEADYAAFTRALREQGLIPAEQWLDFGGLDQVTPQEFYSAAQWQLHKSIAAPYKALLKLMLSEAYAADYPTVDWVSLRIKRALLAKQPPDADRLDPYRLTLERISEYLAGRGETQRLELARRAFYVKAGQQLSRASANPDWRRRELESLVRGWGWGDEELRHMDRRGQWKLARVQQERNALVGELSRGLRLLSEFARDHAAYPGLDTRDLSLLGRKLYAAQERRPGKIDRVNPGISQDLSEPALWLVRQHQGGDERWLLHLRPPGGGEPPVRAAASLVELLAWVQVNGLADGATRVQLAPPPPQQHKPEYQRIREVLQRHLAASDTGPGGMQAYALPARTRHSLLFLDVGRDPQDPDPAPLRHLDHLALTSWGELLVQRHVGAVPALLDALCRHLEDSDPEADGSCHLFGFATPRAATLAARGAELVEAAGAWFRGHGPEARYLARLEGELYLLSRTAEACRWIEVGDTGQLVELLGESDGQFRPTRMDPRALPGSPLPLLLEHNQPDMIQVFYRVHAAGIDCWILDDAGALFEQHLPQAREPHFLAHQRRFFDALLVRRLLHGAVPAADLQQALRFYRLSRNDRGWRLQDMPIPDSPGSYLELLVITGPAGAGGYRVICDQQEFDPLVLGDAFFPTVAAQVLRHRRGGARYPIYITGVQPGGTDSGARWPVAAMLRLKRRLEQRLNAAIGLAGPAEPDS